jgi:hypothetical protein
MSATTDTVLPSTLAADHWAGVQFTLPETAVNLGDMRFALVRQASAASEPVYTWATEDGTITLAPAPGGTGTVATVTGRVLPTAGVYNWRLVGGVGTAPRTWAAGYIIVRAKP